MTQDDTYWKYYENGVEQHRKNNMYEKAKQNLNFYQGRQWEGVQTKNEPLLTLNFIKPIGQYKVASVAQAGMQIVYNTVSKDINTNKVCNILNEEVQKFWEKTKMDKISWDIIKRSFIFGDCYLYSFYDDKKGICNRMINPTNVYFADEQNPDISSQEYIIIDERLPVKHVKKVARKNKIPEFYLDRITADDDLYSQFHEKNWEVESDEGSCTSILYMQKTTL